MTHLSALTFIKAGDPCDSSTYGLMTFNNVLYVTILMTLIIFYMLPY